MAPTAVNAITTAALIAGLIIDPPSAALTLNDTPTPPSAAMTAAVTTAAVTHVGSRVMAVMILVPACPGNGQETAAAAARTWTGAVRAVRSAAIPVTMNQITQTSMASSTRPSPAPGTAARHSTPTAYPG